MPEAGGRELTFAQAIREALAEEMRRDKTVCIMGEDVAEAGTPVSKFCRACWRNSAKIGCSIRRFPRQDSPAWPWARP
jgi:hypothetical protein